MTIKKWGLKETPPLADDPPWRKTASSRFMQIILAAALSNHQPNSLFYFQRFGILFSGIANLSRVACFYQRQN
jgi:hypothetical protein